MKVTVERTPDSQAVLTIEVDQDRVDSSIDQAYKRLAPRARVPGFRPGKAPRALVERHYGKETLLHEALDKLVPVVVREAIEAEQLDIIDQPDLEISSLEPVVVKATVPVRPTIDLGDYRDLRVERKPIDVNPSEVEKTLESLRERYATVEPVERAVEDGDVIRVDVRAMLGEREMVNEEDAELTLSEEGMSGLPGLRPHLLGLEAGAEQTFEVEAPEDAGEGLAGQTIVYTVTIKDVKARTLPELDDEFAKEVGESFPTLAALRERIESDIRTRMETEADQQLEDEVLNKLVEQATIEYPPQLVEREVERMLVDQGAPDDRRSFERLLQRAGISEESLREQYRAGASERVRRSLVLSKLRELEGIAVTPDDVSAELDRIGAGGPQGEQLRQLFDTEHGRAAIQNNLLNKRVIERMRQIALGEAPEPATQSAADDAPEATPVAAASAPDAAGQDQYAETEQEPA